MVSFDWIIHNLSTMEFTEVLHLPKGNQCLVTLLHHALHHVISHHSITMSHHYITQYTDVNTITSCTHHYITVQHCLVNSTSLLHEWQKSGSFYRNEHCLALTHLELGWHLLYTQLVHDKTRYKHYMYVRALSLKWA